MPLPPSPWDISWLAWCTCNCTSTFQLLLIRILITDPFWCAPQKFSFHSRLVITIPRWGIHFLNYLNIVLFTFKTKIMSYWSTISYLPYLYSFPFVSYNSESACTETKEDNKYLSQLLYISILFFNLHIYSHLFYFLCVKNTARIL